ncbi:hypothetical protein [Pseudomonas putida]|uniref:hypothetical protein n=1 Tax=Pseudomonas putida TaxID=303 RepID=UPI001E2DED5D|nr:hypothetical protein [Pseudomonas putida]MCE0958028.1 hypothetical protein [Pseudomonas putida]
MPGLVPVREIAGIADLPGNNPLLWALQMHALRLAVRWPGNLVTLRFKTTIVGGKNRQGVNKFPYGIRTEKSHGNEKKPFLGLLFSTDFYNLTISTSVL